MRYFLSLSFLFTLIITGFSQERTRGAEAENTSASQTGKTHVILIGISEYSNLPDEHQLNFADDDAALFGEYLNTWSNVSFKLYINHKATDDDLIGRDIVNTLLNEAVPGDDVIIYFAGHGDVNEMNEGYLLLSGVESEEPYDFHEP